MFYGKVIFSAEIERLLRGKRRSAVRSIAAMRAARRPRLGAAAPRGGVGGAARRNRRPAPPRPARTRCGVRFLAEQTPSRAGRCYGAAFPSRSCKFIVRQRGDRPAVPGMVFPYGAGVDAEKGAVCFWGLLTAVRTK